MRNSRYQGACPSCCLSWVGQIPHPSELALEAWGVKARRVLGVWPSVSISYQTLKSRLAEVMIGSESIPDPQFAHDNKTAAIGEGPFLVSVPTEKTGSGGKPIRINPLPAQHRASAGRVQKV